MSELEPNYLPISTDDPLATDPLLGSDTFPGSGFDNSPLPAGEELLNLYPLDKGDKLPGAVETILTAADPGDWLTPTFEDNQEADSPDGEKDTLTGVEKEPLEGGDTLIGSGNAASNTTSDRESEIAGDNSESDNSEANTTGEGDAATTASGDHTPTSDNLVIPEAEPDEEVGELTVTDTPEEEPNKEVGELTVTDTPEEEPNKEVGELTVTDTPEEEQLGDQVAHIREAETDKEVADIASDSGKTLVNLSPEEEAAIYQRMQPFTGGVFKVGDTGEVGFDFLYDGGSYKGELAIFSLVGMGEYEPGSPEFIAEAARRASSNSPEGYIVISDPTEGARFNGLLNPYDTPRNQGVYKGVKTFAMTPGDEFGVILVPNGTIQEVLENPNLTGAKRPLFSMTLANPHEAFHVGQIADVTGDGHTYVLEDKRLDSGTDRDYDDFIFQVRGATAQVIHLSEVINPKKDWRQSEEGKALVDYAELSVEIVSGYIEAVKPELSESVGNAVESAENLDNYQAEDLAATQEWVIWINPAQNSDSLASLFGAENLGATGHIEDTYIWKFPKELTAAEVQKSLEDLIGSDFAYPLVPINLTKPQYLPEDPLVGDQWHLDNTGQTGGTPGVDANIFDALNLATGNGIVIGIVDDGVESGHIDLQDNFREDLSIDFNGTPRDEYPLDATPDVDLESNWWWWFWRFYRNIRSGWSRSVDPDQVEETLDPFQHGTAVAGIAAADNNGEGVSGVAPDAEVASVRLTADLVTEKQIADALAHEPQAIAIYNNSWKPDAPLLAAPLTLAALENGVKAGRDRKGNIYVFAGGNDGWLGENVNSNPFANSRYTIAVGAIDHNGEQAWYSEPGASLLVSAPSSSSVTDPLTGEKVSVGITTTDLQGEKGYNSGTEKTDSNTDKQYTATDLPQKTDSPTNQTDITNTNYTNRFGGTSAAAPIVSGVVALMLEANPDLTWRDVQHILVETATKNNPTDTDWVTNSGGYQVNQKYGFGTVNGAQAVQAAQTWTNVAPEIAVKSSWQQVNQTIPDYDTVGLLGQQVADILSKNPADLTEAEKAMLPALPPTNPQSVSAKMDIAEDINIEWVEVVFEAQHTARGDLKVTLVAPDGTESLLTDRHADPNSNYDKWTFTSNRHWGESSQGNGPLKVADEWGNEVGTWNGWKLNFYGTENPTVNIRATDNNATEDGNSGQYIVTRTGGNINKPLTVQYQIGGSATNGSDYTINGVTSPQTITFAPGQTTATIGINPIHDYEVEPSQNVQLSLVDAGAIIWGLTPPLR
ncbi:S8 family serine peptidase [[Phormidium] sp. ETS-05]|uniref:S8 family serine peptidase n=1 Tax=[Phormidium] sp. ETS-05 TaxID=222819 RepID=UPI0018EED5CC|nr:S8 family serine peptidase [[Phormidium] sp. ETS-05]